MYVARDTLTLKIAGEAERALTDAHTNDTHTHRKVIEIAPQE